MQRWTCKDCGKTLESERIVLPYYHQCGDRVRAGKDQTAITDFAGEFVPMVSKPAKVKNYSQAVLNWIAAGQPNRSDSEVESIFRDHCTGCEFLKEGTCNICGCPVRASDDSQSLLGIEVNPALVNKIRMATEHCPIEKW